MPCRSYSEEEERETLQRDADRLAQLLCSTLAHLEDFVFHQGCGQVLQALPQDVREWWAEHKRRDDERKAQEARDAEADRARESAKAKLTPHERALLGLDR